MRVRTIGEADTAPGAGAVARPKDGTRRRARGAGVVAAATHARLAGHGAGAGGAIRPAIGATADPSVGAATVAKAHRIEQPRVAIHPRA